MKLICLGPIPPPYTGQSICFKILIDGLKKNNTEFKIVNISSKFKKNNSHYVRFYRIIDYFFILFNFCRKLIFNKSGVVYLQISQSRQGFYRDFFIIWFAKLFNDRIVAHLHGGNYDGFYYSQSRWMQKIIKFTLRKVDKIVILSERLRYMFDFDGTLKNNIFVIQNCLPSNQREIFKKGKEIKLNEPIRILFLSNLIESKGYFDLLKAVNILVKEYHKNVTCKFCGEFLSNIDDLKIKSAKDGKEKFEDYIEKNKLKKYVKYDGVVSGQKKEQILKWAHFFVLPTIYIYEGQPLSIIEAIANGCVIISTEYRAIPDMVKHNKNGILIKYGRPEEIALTINNISENPDKYKLMSLSSIQLYEKYFTEDVYLKKMIQLISS